MKTASRPITIRTYSDYAHKITLPSADEDGNSIDWTSATFLSKIRDTPTGAVLATFSIDVTHTSSTPPYILLTLTDTVTSGLSPGAAVWDLAETRASSTRFPIGGKVTIEAGVSHA